jgi:hypothetical protein
MHVLIFTCDTLQAWLAAGKDVARCTQCGPTNRGECHFREGIGPYCYKAPKSREVVPCEKCCSDPKVLLNNNGYCF